MLKKLFITTALVVSFVAPAFAAPSGHRVEETRQEMQHNAKDAAKHRASERMKKENADVRREAEKPGHHAKKTEGHAKKQKNDHKKEKAGNQPNHLKDHKSKAKKAPHDAGKKKVNREAHRPL